MSTFFAIDSRWRDRTQYPSPAEFDIGVEVARGWRTFDRTVTAVVPQCGNQITNLVHDVKLVKLEVPWNVNVSLGTWLVNSSSNATLISGSGVITLESVPYLYVEFRSTSMYNDKALINFFKTSFG